MAAAAAEAVTATAADPVTAAAAATAIVIHSFFIHLNSQHRHPSLSVTA